MSTFVFWRTLAGRLILTGLGAAFFFFFWAHALGDDKTTIARQTTTKAKICRCGADGIKRLKFI
jgi:hypothetical protein